MDWSWQQAITWCVTAICITVLCVCVTIHANATWVANCDRRAEMLEKIAADNPGSMFIFEDETSP